MSASSRMNNAKCQALKRCIHDLVDDIFVAVSESNYPQVYQVCNILHPQLLRIKQELINGDQLTDFLYCIQTVTHWSKDIRGARLEKWPSIAACILGVVDAYEEIECSDEVENFVAALLGDDFLQLYGQQFGQEIISYFSKGCKNNIERKRQIIASLWRYYEQFRKEFDSSDGLTGKYIGTVLNKLSIRHEDGKQWTSEFLKSHTEAEYEMLLDNVMLLMINAFARRNLDAKILPSVKGMLNV